MPELRHATGYVRKHKFKESVERVLAETLDSGDATITIEHRDKDDRVDIRTDVSGFNSRLTDLENSAMRRDDYDADGNLIVDNAERLAETRDLILVITNGQTVFTLSKAAFQAPYSTLTLNGVKQTFGVDYSITGATLTWLSGVVLATSDELEIIYR